MRTRMFLVLAVLACAVSAKANTYYIAASGSDANTSTQAQSKSTPWLHAPGMPSCTSACASYTPVAGDHFIFRGGDTWHYGTGTPLVGGTWVWSWSGTSGSPIYIGVDQTWFTGASWVRPVLNGDNTPTTSFITSCAHVTPDQVHLGGNSYVTFDSFEFTGKCWSTGDGPTSVDYGGGSHLTVSNNYFHGWMTCSGCADDGYQVLGNTNNPTQRFSTVSGNVFDGSDTRCTGANACEGFSIYGDGTYVFNNVFRYVSNVVVVDDELGFHDNLVEFSFEPFDPATHGNVDEMLGYNPTGTPPSISIYNNITRHTNNGVTFWPEPASGQTLYVFNNVFYDIGNSANCFLLDNAAGGTQTDYFYNNTVDQPCPLPSFYGQHTGNNYSGTAYFQNNHYIGSSTTWATTFGSSGTVTMHNNNNGGHVFQTEAVANGQGYVPGNAYAPTASGNATVAAGINASASCSTFSADSALCSGTGGGSAEQSGSGGKVSVTPAITVNARPASTAWDTGAYQFSATPAPGASVSPSSLTFPNQQILTTSSGMTVTLTNTGNATLNITSIVISGTNSADFGQSTTCGSTLGQGSNCTVTITFTPAAVGTRSATLTFTDNAGTGTQTAALSGTGVNITPPLPHKPVLMGSLPNGTVGVSYSAALSVSGATPPDVWSVNPTLPGGLTMSPVTGLISGTPIISVTALPSTFQVTDSYVCGPTDPTGCTNTSDPYSTPLTIAATPPPQTCGTGSVKNYSATSPINLSVASPSVSVAVIDTCTANVPVTIATDQPWLSVSPASGSTAFATTVQANTAGLAPGTYPGHIILSAPLWSNSPLADPVVLTVPAPPPPPTPSLSCPQHSSTSTTDLVYCTIGGFSKGQTGTMTWTPTGGNPVSVTITHP